ncbi:extracellular solute-binding protein [Allonocardiopsis opalescens]|uniref:Carbohydrate ABC transporter substrate-binding protein (CUT1 family) n=1 Tax=Allonocardiopsis opalescens TaxID=1144618 RepID=A0A2T0PZG0_9ACTN|nr:extracellular solute-binding protein [Allonocardiopsis opalescens]PRX96797.1 carbohydrate ABC transporter substrate-binding protein (CUT1 family) [Allonocardiopsis opalescens]
MRMRILAAATAAGLLAAVSGCGGGTSEEEGQTLTYWATNQGTSLENDAEVLQPALDRFEEETGITVELEVIPWADILNRILAATTSGEGPDVLNIGNTWSASLQATGAFVPFDAETLEAIDGTGRFVESSLASTGAPGQDPTSVPLYGMSYGLFYNRAMFEEAGIEEPPATWEELIEVGQEITGDGRWGFTLEGAAYTDNAHQAFIMGEQHGAVPFNEDGTANFATPQQVAALQQYLDLMGEHGIVNPSNAEFSNGTQAVTEFAQGNAAMMIRQAGTMRALEEQGMTTEDYGVAPVPLPDPLPEGGRPITSMVAGINISVFNNSDNPEGALEFVRFMTSAQTQIELNSAYGTLPVVTDAADDPAFQTEQLAVFQETLLEYSAPMPQVPEESQYETLIGTAMAELFAQIASGEEVTEADIEAQLSAANEQLTVGG